MPIIAQRSLPNLLTIADHVFGKHSFFSKPLSLYFISHLPQWAQSVIKVYPNLGGCSPLVGCALSWGGYLGLGVLACVDFLLFPSSLQGVTNQVFFFAEKIVGAALGQGTAQFAKLKQKARKTATAHPPTSRRSQPRAVQDRHRHHCQDVPQSSPRSCPSHAPAAASSAALAR